MPTIGIYLTDDEVASVVYLAMDRNKKVSEFITELVRDSLKRIKKEKGA